MIDVATSDEVVEEGVIEATGGRIALLLPSLANGGAERVMLNIAHGLVERDDVAVDLVLTQAVGPYLEQVSPKVNVVNLDSKRIFYSIIPLIRYLRAVRPAAVLSALDTTNLILIWAVALARVETRVVVSVHCNFSSALKGQKNFRSRLLPYLVRRSYPYADKILTVSEGVASDLVSSTGLSRELLTVQVNPVITPELMHKSEQPCEHSWLCDNRGPVVLATGRLTYQKNFDLLLRAFAIVRQSIDARLIVLGEGEELAALQSLAEQLEVTDQVDFPGFVENPYSYMSAASLFVLSSHFEGLPTVLIEALQCGVPVVSTDCPSGPEEILEGGRLGTLTQPGDVSALAEAMVRSLRSDRSRTEKSRALDKYYLDNVVQAYRQHVSIE
jgi:glycosyltransferase involved in cell wall biosynthesis